MSARAAAASTKVRLGPGAAAFPAHSDPAVPRRGFPTAPTSPHRGGRGFNPRPSRMEGRWGAEVGEAGRSLPAAFPADLPCCQPGGARRWPHPRPGPCPAGRPRPALTCWSAGPGAGRLRQAGPAPARSPRQKLPPVRWPCPFVPGWSRVAIRKDSTGRVQYCRIFSAAAESVGHDCC